MSSSYRPGSGIKLTGRWTAVADHFALRLAVDHSNTLTLEPRLMFLAQAYSDVEGCARFERGTVQTILNIKQASSLSRAIASAEKFDMLGTGSTPTCLFLPWADIDRAKSSVLPKPGPGRLGVSPAG